MNSIKNQIHNGFIAGENDDTPDWVVRIEEVGEYTGISVIKPFQLIEK